jgi:hypothetical protein
MYEVHEMSGAFMRKFGGTAEIISLCPKMDKDFFILSKYERMEQA